MDVNVELHITEYDGSKDVEHTSGRIIAPGMVIIVRENELTFRSYDERHGNTVHVDLNEAESLILNVASLSNEQTAELAANLTGETKLIDLVRKAIEIEGGER